MNMIKVFQVDFLVLILATISSKELTLWEPNRLAAEWGPHLLPRTFLIKWQKGYKYEKCT